MSTYMLIPLVGLALAAISPSPQNRATVSASVADSTRSAVRVEVDNHNFLDMRVYAVSNGRQWRLGTVTSFTSESFELPRFIATATGEVSLVASPIGSRSVYVAQPILVEPGDQVLFNVENQIALSSVLVRP